MNELLIYLRTINWKDKQTGKRVKIDAGYFGIISYCVSFYGWVILLWYVFFKIGIYTTSPTLNMAILFVVLYSLVMTYMWFHFDEFDIKAKEQNSSKRYKNLNKKEKL